MNNSAESTHKDSYIQDKSAMAEANGTNGTMFGSDLDHTPITHKSRLTNSDYDQVFQKNMVQTMALPSKR